jgi:hypothetical protein
MVPFAAEIAPQQRLQVGSGFQVFFWKPSLRNIINIRAFGDAAGSERTSSEERRFWQTKDERPAKVRRQRA